MLPAQKTGSNFDTGFALSKRLLRSVCSEGKKFESSKHIPSNNKKARKCNHSTMLSRKSRRIRVS